MSLRRTRGTQESNVIASVFQMNGRDIKNVPSKYLSERDERVSILSSQRGLAVRGKNQGDVGWFRN